MSRLVDYIESMERLASLGAEWLAKYVTSATPAFEIGAGTRVYALAHNELAQDVWAFRGNPATLHRETRHAYPSLSAVESYGPHHAARSRFGGATKEWVVIASPDMVQRWKEDIEMARKIVPTGPAAPGRVPGGMTTEGR